MSGDESPYRGATNLSDWEDNLDHDAAPEHSSVAGTLVPEDHFGDAMWHRVESE